MTLSAEHFLRQLAGSGLFTQAQFDELRKSVPTGAGSADDVAIALVKEGRLTPFQAKELLKGNGHNLVLGNYTLIEKIGAGGIGVVYKAVHRRMYREVALKVLPDSAMDSEQATKRFHREVQTAARLSHPNIVTAYDADESNGTHFLVMEFVRGNDLAATVKKRGPLPIAAALDCMVQAARGLEYAHSRGVVHRDIKPSNLLINSQGTLQILDMGLARLCDPNREEQTDLTSSGYIMGTIDYMAPEQALDTKNADHRADIFSLGATLYYLLTGSTILAGKTRGQKLQTLLSEEHELSASLQTLRPDVPDELERVFQKMIAHRVENRYQLISEVSEDLLPQIVGASRDTPVAVGNGEGSVAAPASGNPDSLGAALLEFLVDAPLESTLIGSTDTSQAIEPPPEATSQSIDISEPTSVTPPSSPAIERESAAHQQEPHARARRVLTAVAMVFFALLAGWIAAKIRPRHGTVLVKLPAGFNGQARVNVDGQTPEVSAREDHTIAFAVTPGQHNELKITVDGVRVLTEMDQGFEIDAGQELTVAAKRAPTPADSNNSAPAGEKPEHQWINLLAQIAVPGDVPTEPVPGGDWELVDGALRSPAQKFARIGAPIATDNHYRLRAEFTRQSGHDAVDFFLPVGGRQVLVVIDGFGGEGLSGLQAVKQQNLPIPGKTGVDSFHLRNGTRYTLETTVEVDQGEATIHVRLGGSGGFTFEWAGPVSDLSLIDSQFDLGDTRRFGLGAWNSVVDFHRLELQKLSPDPP
ncbi:MAG: serine/threonine protein kinase [Pirellulales bacterium]|nr:serine/threonine protein kinase [Pirellulales bacterium]